MAKTIFITGASRGFGRIWTEAFLERGDNVVAAVRKPETLTELSKAFPSNLLVDVVPFWFTLLRVSKY